MSQNLTQALDVKIKLYTTCGKRVPQRMKFNWIQTAFLLNQAEMFLHGTWFQILVFTGCEDISMLVRIVFLDVIDQCIRKRDLSEGTFALGVDISM